MVYELTYLFPTERELNLFKSKVAEMQKPIIMEQENMEEVENTEEVEETEEA
jgi:hypothetical protein